MCVNKSNSFLTKLLLLQLLAVARRQFIMTRTSTRKASNIDEISAAINFHTRRVCTAQVVFVCLRCSAPRNADDAVPSAVGDPSAVNSMQRDSVVEMRMRRTGRIHRQRCPSAKYRTPTGVPAVLPTR